MAAAPRIALLRHVADRVGVELEGIPAGWAADRVFVVVCEGEFAGRRWHRGDVLLCRPEADPVGPRAEQGPVVLVARKHGSPRFGTVQGHVVRGDAGEPCSPDRWRSAGAIACVLQGDAALVQACVRYAALVQVVVPGLARAASRNRGLGRGEAAEPGALQRGGRGAPAHSIAPQLPLFERHARAA